MAARIGLHDLVSTAAEAIAPVSDCAVRMSTAATSPDVGAPEVGQIAAEDPGTATVLLREANSAALGAAASIDTVPSAVARLGVARSVAIAVGASTDQLMAVPLPAYGLGDGEFLRHAKSASMICELIRNRSPQEVSPASITSALIHSIGKVLLDPHLTNGHLHAAATADGSIFEAESELLDLNHAELGAFLCSAWGLPSVIVESLGEQASTSMVDTSLDSAAVFASRMLADDLLERRNPSTEADVVRYSECVGRLDLRDGFVEEARSCLIDREIPYVQEPNVLAAY